MAPVPLSPPLFFPLSHPPPPPREIPIVTFAATISGTVAGFDRDLYVANLAAQLDGVSPSDISLQVTAASVRVVATIESPTADIAWSAFKALQAASVAKLIAALAVVVEVAEPPTITALPALPPPADAAPSPAIASTQRNLSDPDLARRIPPGDAPDLAAASGGLAAPAVVSVVLAFAAVASCLLWLWRRRRRRHALAQTLRGVQMARTVHAADARELRSGRTVASTPEVISVSAKSIGQAQRASAAATPRTSRSSMRSSTRRSSAHDVGAIPAKLRRSFGSTYSARALRARQANAARREALARRQGAAPPASGIDEISSTSGLQRASSVLDRRGPASSGQSQSNVNASVEPKTQVLTHTRI